MKHILILGGTTEARKLAQLLAMQETYQITFSLAGILRGNTDEALRNKLGFTGLERLTVRSGGFGGAEGLAQWLRENSIFAVIDATHPYAEQMSRNAHAAVAQTTIKLLRLTRPPWQQTTADRWLHAADLDSAAELLPPKSRVFLSVGSQSVARFESRQDCHFVIRSMQSPSGSAFGATADLIKAMPNDTVEQEAALLTKYSIDYLVTKNSGASIAFNKILAARALGIGVVMIERPKLPLCSEFNDLVDLENALRRL